MSGLDATVVEMLRNYQPSSSERRPFWCRICRYQGGDEADLVRHRASESHRRAIRVERRLSFCSKCRKQFGVHLSESAERTLEGQGASRELRGHSNLFYCYLENSAG